MKTNYEAPQMDCMIIMTSDLISASTTDQDVYTDDPQSPGDALIKNEIL